jgi:hypothetical protein
MEMEVDFGKLVTAGRCSATDAGCRLAAKKPNWLKKSPNVTTASLSSDFISSEAY